MKEVREVWLGVKGGGQDASVRQTIFLSTDGCKGMLTECHITGDDSAHPGAWMFRLSDPVYPNRWHWEMELVVE
jgi:hypothetical protein